MQLGVGVYRMKPSQVKGQCADDVALAACSTGADLHTVPDKLAFDLATEKNGGYGHMTDVWTCWTIRLSVATNNH